MITANFMNAASVKNGNIQQVVSRRAQEDNVEATEVFAGIMNQTMDISNNVAEESVFDMDVSKSNNTSSSLESYDRYSYKSNRIEKAEEFTATQKLEDSVEPLEQVAEEVVNTICDAYNLDEDTVQNLLDEMGLNPLDLLNPQNLVSFLVTLTGAASGEQLLWDENFLKVMEMVNSIAENLMSNLDVDANGLQELVAKMDVVESAKQEDTLPADETLEMPLEQNEPVDNTVAETKVSDTDSVDANAKKGNVVAETTVSENAAAEIKVSENTTAETMISEEKVVSDTDVIQAKNAETVEQVSQQAEIPEEVLESTAKDGQHLDVKSENQEETSEIKVQIVQDGDLAENSASKKEFSFTEDNRGSENRSLFQQNTDANQAVLTNQMPVNANQVTDVPQMFASYLSADTVQIMEQVVQQMRVNITSEMTSMEMQLNPENLGRIFVNISAEEGIVSAKFQATNEVVKEALEVQIATLRENLNQAGVKVDAIEVTIASHEFERNLEQNQQKPEEQTDGQTNAATSKRRNITIDSLDELSGLMTEEESLVAQIMKDNGNSVDLTA